MAEDFVGRLNKIVDAKIASYKPLFEKFFNDLFLAHVERALENQTDNIKVLNVVFYTKKQTLLDYGIHSGECYMQHIMDSIDKLNSMGFRYHMYNSVYEISLRDGRTLLLQKLDFNLNILEFTHLSIKGEYVEPKDSIKSANKT